MLVNFNHCLRQLKVHSQRINSLASSRGYATINNVWSSPSPVVVVKVNIDWNEQLPDLSVYWRYTILYEMEPFEKYCLYLSSESAQNENVVDGICKYEVMCYSDDDKCKMLLISSVLKEFSSFCKLEDVNENTVIKGELVKVNDVIIDEGYKGDKYLTTDSVISNLVATLPDKKGSEIEFFDLTSMDDIDWYEIMKVMTTCKPYLFIVCIQLEDKIVSYSKIYIAEEHLSTQTNDEIYSDVERLEHRHGTKPKKILGIIEINSIKS